MITFPNAKINIGLNVVAKREDGYHNLETIFYPISVCDALEVTLPASSDLRHDSLHIDGLTIDSDNNKNLVMKALMLMRKYYSFPLVNINLLKKIPMGAGIGGGSADAAFTLKLINNFFKLNIEQTTLAQLAAQLGADCPFFIYNTPKYAEGIGEKLESINLDLEKYYICLIKPNLFISTKEAFANIKPKPNTQNLKELIKRPLEEWKFYLKNDFEESLFPKYLELRNIKNKLYELGAIYSSMTGSGASLYAISEKPLTNIEKSFTNCYIWRNKI